MLWGAYNDTDGDMLLEQFEMLLRDCVKLYQQNTRAIMDSDQRNGMGMAALAMKVLFRRSRSLTWA